MARHSKKRKSTHRRRRSHRMGAVDVKKIGTKVLGVALGGFGARTLNNFAVKTFPTIDPKIIAGGNILVGALVPKFLKSDLGSAVGDGFIAIGSVALMQGLGVLGGMGAARRVPVRVIGAGNQPFLSKMVGATTRPYIRQTVGGGRMGSAYGQMEAMNRAAMGAAGGLGALAMEE